MTVLFKRLFDNATMMYVAALAMSGFVILVSVGVAIGVLSIETFFLARGRAWLQDRAGRRSLAVYATDVWLLAWVLTQALMAVVMWVRYGARFAAMARATRPSRSASTGWGLTHTSAVAQIFMYRFDRLSPSRYQGPDDLAVCSLAVAAIEFSQAGAMVATQRRLGDHEQGSGDWLRGWLRKAVLYAVGIGRLVLVGLAGLGLVVGGYRGAQPLPAASPSPSARCSARAWSTWVASV
jgi:hypothetical protein